MFKKWRKYLKEKAKSEKRRLPITSIEHAELLAYVSSDLLNTQRSKDINVLRLHHDFGLISYIPKMVVFPLNSFSLNRFFSHFRAAVMVVSSF